MCTVTGSLRLPSLLLPYVALSRLALTNSSNKASPRSLRGCLLAAPTTRSCKLYRMRGVSGSVVGQLVVLSAAVGGCSDWSVRENVSYEVEMVVDLLGGEGIIAAVLGRKGMLSVCECGIDTVRVFDKPS